MEAKSKNVSKKHQKSADFAFEHTHSAYELGDLMNNNPLALLDLDMGFQTRWYDCDFIEEAMSFIREEADMLMFMTLIVKSWREQTAKLCNHVAYRDPKTKQAIPYISDLDTKLNEIHDRLMCDREQIKEASAFRDMFLKKYSDPTNTIDLSTPKPINMPKTASSTRQSTKPDTGPFTVLLEDLPEDVRSKVLLDQPLFNVFVKQLNEDTWSIIDANKETLCDALRFVCIKRNIIARETDREIFDKLLHCIVISLKDQPSLISSMKRRTDTSSNKIGRSIICYDSPIKKHQHEVWQLINDCKPIEESLQPVYEAMEMATAST